MVKAFGVRAKSKTDGQLYNNKYSAMSVKLLIMVYEN